MFDLPADVAPLSSAAQWAKALNKRDFQDKQLRVVQYIMKGVAGWALKYDIQSSMGLACSALCKRLSLSRKAFRFLRSFADLHAAMSLARAAFENPEITKLLGIVQWVLMALHVFFDNWFFIAHGDLANQFQKDFRAAADTIGFLAALITYKRVAAAAALQASRSKRTKRKRQASSVPCAFSRRREAWYAVVKLAADVLTYLPQASVVAGWSQAIAWHDGYIGIAGVVASLVSCRNEWIKVAK